MPKHIVILSGSPRKNGNTDKLITAFQTGTVAAGNVVSLFHTANMNIYPCSGCEYCHDYPGQCVLQDDMEDVLEALEIADVIVWASPVYFFSFSAQLKTAIDRCYPLINEGAKQTALLLTCADEDCDTAAGATAIYERMLRYYKWENAGVVIANGVEHLGDIAGHKALAEAEALGRGI